MLIELIQETIKSAKLKKINDDLPYDGETSGFQ